MKKTLKEKKKLIHQGFDNFPFFREMVVKYFCLNCLVFVCFIGVCVFICSFLLLKKHSIVRTVTYVLHVDVT